MTSGRSLPGVRSTLAAIEFLQRSRRNTETSGEQKLSLRRLVYARNCKCDEPIVINRNPTLNNRATRSFGGTRISSVEVARNSPVDRGSLETFWQNDTGSGKSRHRRTSGLPPGNRTTVTEVSTGAESSSDRTQPVANHRVRISPVQVMMRAARQPSRGGLHLNKLIQAIFN